jgi:hypothetical protein
VLDLNFQVEGVEAVAFAAAPTLALKLRIANAAPAEQIQAILLRCQIQLEVTRRRYQPGEREKLFDLFGPPPEWGRTLRRILWTQVSVNVPAFAGSTAVDLPVPCTYDLNVATTKYFHALADGDVPLRLLFSGTVFYAGDRGALQAVQIPWEKEAVFRLPVHAWRDMMDHYYPNSAWLCLRKDLLDRLAQYKQGSGSVTWEQTFENLLAAVGEKVVP